MFPVPDSLTRHSGLWRRWRGGSASLRFPNTPPWGVKSLFQHFLPIRCQLRPSLSTSHQSPAVPTWLRACQASLEMVVPLLHTAYMFWNVPGELRTGLSLEVRALSGLPWGCCFQTILCTPLSFSSSHIAGKGHWLMT